MSTLNQILPISAASHLVRSLLAKSETVDPANIQVEVTFSGLAVSLQLHASCSKIIQTSSFTPNSLTGENGLSLTKHDTLPTTCNVVFTPEVGFSGEAVIVYSLSGASKILAAAVVQVVPCNHAPTAKDDYAESVSGGVLRLNILQNDDDVNDQQFACMDLPRVETDDSVKPKMVSFTNVAHELGLRHVQIEIRTR